MLKSTVKTFLSFSFLFCITPLTALTQSKICEIKYNQKGNSKSLERIANIKGDYKKVNQKGLFDCYRIGLEHDINRTPIINKPIYACCRNI